MSGAKTGKILFGMLVGVLVGVLLMYFSPVPLQPGDRIRVTSADESVVWEGIISKKVVSDIASAGSIDEEGNLVLGGLSKKEALEALGNKGRAASRIQLLERESLANVVVMPPLTTVLFIIGQLFIKLLKMLIIPLIVATVFVGIAGLGDMGKMGRLGKHTLLLYVGTMLVASTIGMILVGLIRPGVGLGWTSGASNAESPTVQDLILRIVPENPIGAMVQFDVIGTLFFTIFVGLAVLKLGKHKCAPFFNFFEALNDIVYVLVGWVMSVAPIGVGALLAYFIAIQVPEYVTSLLGSLGKFAMCVSVGLLLQFILLTLLVRLLGKYPPGQFVSRMSPALATALGTDSSSATMPVTLTCVRNTGVSKRIAGFVVPVGATANMDGTALYEATAALFFAQAYGVDLTAGQHVLVVLTAVAAAVGAAGIPSAGLVTMTLVLTAVGLPLEGIALLFAIDRPLDMLRTAVNVYGDAVASRIVQTWNPDIRPEDDDTATAYEVVEPEAAYGG